jgi:hypothetical protein
MFNFELRSTSFGLILAALGCAAAGPVVLGSEVAIASDSKSEDETLIIDEKDQASSIRDGQLIVLLNFQNARAQLGQRDDASEKIKTTAARYARIYFAKPQYAQITRAVVYPVYIQSMDEYRQANFAGMVRLGTISFERAGADISITENKLSLP